MRKIDTIVIHCTATPEGRDVTAQTVRGWHKAKGWKDIGYHYLIRLDGCIEKGREDATIGAHVAGHNAHSIGVCYVGGVDVKGKPKDTRTQEQKDALRRLVKVLLQKYPGSAVVGHHDLDKGKACPSFNAKAEYARL